MIRHSWTAVLWGAVAILLSVLSQQLAAGKVPVPDAFQWVVPVAVAVMVYIARGLPNGDEGHPPAGIIKPPT